MQAIANTPTSSCSSYDVGTSTLSKIFSKATFDKISSVATHVFFQLATALALNLAFDFAFGVLILPISAHLLTIACAASLAVVIAIKVGKCIYEHFKTKPESSTAEAPKSQENSSTLHEDIAKGVAQFSLVNTLLLKPSILIHECGHALAAVTCFVKASPKMVIKWASGLTEYSISNGLTKFGSFLGEEMARVFVTAAGLVFPAVFALVEFSLAFGLNEKHPWLSDLLNYHGLSQLLNLGLYGISALASSKMALAHDFIYMWTFAEIHPLILTAILVGIPLCAFIIFKYFEHNNTTKMVQSA